LLDYNLDAIEITTAATNPNHNGVIFGYFINGAPQALYQSEYNKFFSLCLDEKAYSTGLSYTDLNKHTFKITSKKLYVDSDPTPKADFSNTTISEPSATT
jgi:hypothetical protein